MPTTFVLTAVLVTLGAALQAMVGFGFSILSVPFLLLLYPAKSAVALSLALSLGGNLLQWFRVREHVNYPLTVKLAVGALFGVPVGSLVLMMVSPDTLKLLVGLSVLAAVVVTLLRREHPDQPLRMPQTRPVLITGFLAGLLAGSVGQPGTPVALLMARTGLDKAVVRATLVTFFLTVNVGSLFTMTQTGIFTSAIAVTAAATFPFYVIGLLIGERGFRLVDQNSYRRLVLGVLTTAAVMGVINGLSALN